MSAQKTKPRGVLSAVLGMLSFSVLAGLLVTVMVTPAIAVTGVAATSTIGIFDSLPEFIEINQQPERNEIWAKYSGEGNVDGFTQIATIYDQNRQEVTFDEISEFARDAAVDGEDRRFYSHGGVDVQSVIRAAVGNLRGGDIDSGASTLTMQLVKNIYVQSALQQPTEEQRKAAYDLATDQSFNRKLKEMKLAIGLEKKYTKKEILAAYLNIAFFGDNTYGIEAAAQRYYSVHAKDLTLPQAASLIAIVQEPSARGLDDPENYEANKERRDVILGSMREANSITEEQYREALATPIDDTTLVPSSPSNGCMAAEAHSKWFCDYVEKNIENFEALGANPEERAANWKRGGYKLYTTLDLDIQINAQEQTWAYAPAAETQLELGSVTDSVEVGTGRVLAMTENKHFSNTLESPGPEYTAVNYNTDYGYGGSSGIQPGSTYKIFVLLNWLQNGHGLNETVDGNARSIPVSQFLDSCNGPWSGEPWKFRNDSGERGAWTVNRGTSQSVNGVFASMGLQLDQCSIAKTAESLGVHRADGDPLQTNPSAVLGTNEIAPLTMAAAYAGIAAGGKYCKPVILDRVINPNGEELPGQAQDCVQAIDPDVVATAMIPMADVPNGLASRSNPHDGIPIIGKTGTTDGAKDTWVIISSTRVATAVWIGNVVGDYSMRDYRANGVYGGDLRHAIMRDTLTVTNAVYGGGDFPSASGNLLKGAGATVPDVSNQTLEQAQSVITGLGFGFADGGQVDSALPAGTVVSTDPGAGSVVSKGMTVTVYTSNGSLTAFPDIVSDNPTFNDAKNTLQAAGYSGQINAGCVVSTISGDPLIGKVTASDPAPGTPVKSNVNVTLTVTKASCP